MLTNQKLNTLVFEIVKHDALVVACDTNGPLLELAHDALATLFGYSRDIALSSRVLIAQMVSIFHEQVLYHLENWSCRRPSKNRLRVIVKRKGISLSEATIITLKLYSPLLIFWLGHLSADHVHYFFDGPHWYFTLGYVCSIKTVDTIRAENSRLLLNDSLLSESFFDEEAEFRLNILDLHHQVINFMEIVTMSFAVKIIPYMLQILFRVQLKELY